jgi:hypothetical protein
MFRKTEVENGSNIRIRIRYIRQNLRNGFHPIVIGSNYPATINMPINISFFPSFFLSFLFRPLLPTHSKCTGLMLRLKHSVTHTHTVEIPWTRERPFGETST